MAIPQEKTKHTISTLNPKAYQRKIVSHTMDPEELAYLPVYDFAKLTSLNGHNPQHRDTWKTASIADTVSITTTHPKKTKTYEIIGRTEDNKLIYFKQKIHSSEFTDYVIHSGMMMDTKTVVTKRPPVNILNVDTIPFITILAYVTGQLKETIKSKE